MSHQTASRPPVVLSQLSFNCLLTVPTNVFRECFMALSCYYKKFFHQTMSMLKSGLGIIHVCIPGPRSLLLGSNINSPSSFLRMCFYMGTCQLQNACKGSKKPRPTSRKFRASAGRQAKSLLTGQGTHTSYKRESAAVN